MLTQEQVVSRRRDKSKHTTHFLAMMSMMMAAREGQSAAAVQREQAYKMCCSCEIHCQLLKQIMAIRCSQIR